MRMSPSKQLCNVWHERKRVRRWRRNKSYNFGVFGMRSLEWSSDLARLEWKKNRPHIVGQSLIITLYIIADIFELTRDSSNMHKMIWLKYLHTYNSFSILTNKMYLVVPFLWWFNEEIYRKLYDSFISTLICIDISIVYFHMNQFINCYSHIERSTTAAWWINLEIVVQK